jgi:hypothetical protein
VTAPARRPWPPEHEVIARTMLGHGHSLAEVATALNRTHASVRHWRFRDAHRHEREHRRLARHIADTHRANPAMSNQAIAEATGAKVQMVVRILAMPMPQFRDRYAEPPPPRPPQIGPQP